MSVIACERQESYRPSTTAATRAGLGFTDLMLPGMAAIWGLNFSIMKYGTGVMMPLVYSGLRVMLAAMVLLVFAALTRDPVGGDRSAPLAGGGLQRCLVSVASIISGLLLTRAWATP